MGRNDNRNLLPRAKELRGNMTKEEKKLWYDFLKKQNPKFLRQKIIGNYIVDFYCAKLKLVIEVDGAQHYKADNRKYDAKRTEYLESLGLTVIRILNRDINRNFVGVCSGLSNFIKDRCIYYGLFSDEIFPQS